MTKVRPRSLRGSVTCVIKDLNPRLDIQSTKRYTTQSDRISQNAPYVENSSQVLVDWCGTNSPTLVQRHLLVNDVKSRTNMPAPLNLMRVPMKYSSCESFKKNQEVFEFIILWNVILIKKIPMLLYCSIGHLWQLLSFLLNFHLLSIICFVCNYVWTRVDIFFK